MDLLQVSFQASEKITFFPYMAQTVSPLFNILGLLRDLVLFASKHVL